MEGGVGKGAEVTTEKAAQASNEGSGERWIHGQCLPKTFEVSFAVFYNHTGGINCTCRLLPLSPRWQGVVEFTLIISARR